MFTASSSPIVTELLTKKKQMPMTILPLKEYCGEKSSEFVDVYDLRKKLRAFIKENKEDLFDRCKIKIAVVDHKCLRVRLMSGPFDAYDGVDSWGHSKYSEEVTAIHVRIRDFLSQYLTIRHSNFNGSNSVSFDAEFEVGKWDIPFKRID